MAIKLSELETRVLGLLVETQLREPQKYPVTLDYLLVACKGKVPVDKEQLKEALAALEMQKLVTASGALWLQPRRYQHRFACVERPFITLTQAELALLGVLMAEGPLGPSQLFEQGAKLYPFKNQGEVVATLNQMLNYSATPLVSLLPFEEGQSEQRYTHLFDVAAASEAEMSFGTGDALLAERVAELESDNAELRERLNLLQKQVDLLFKASPNVSKKFIV